MPNPVATWLTENVYYSSSQYYHTSGGRRRIITSKCTFYEFDKTELFLLSKFQLKQLYNDMQGIQDAQTA